MTTIVSHGVQGSGTSRYDFMTRPYVLSPSHNNELDSVKKQLELLKAADPFSVVDMAIEIQNERKKVQDATSARDAAVTRLADAYVSLGQKTAMIEKLQEEMRVLGTSGTNDVCKADKGTLTANPVEKVLQEVSSQTEDTDEAAKLQQVARLETLVNSLTEEIKMLRADKENRERLGLQKDNASSNLVLNPFLHHRATPPVLSRASSWISSISSSESMTGMTASPLSPSFTDITSVSGVDSIFRLDDHDFDFAVVRTSPPSGEAEDIINARNKLLAVIPLPEEVPDDTLKPIVIPSSYTLHEFLAMAPESLKTSLDDYRALQQLTTSWCPDREEHGYFLTPVFKCNTNPRVSMAHRWTTVDLLSKLNKPTECFYNKDGVWYYAGVYKAFRLDDLTTKEWEALSNETIQSIIKETTSARKNTSPQNIYEITQLYAAGALRVACIALQCVGFNKSVYQGVLEHAEKLKERETGKWNLKVASGRTGSTHGRTGSSTTSSSSGSVSSGLGLGSSGAAWNVNANTNSVNKFVGSASLGDLTSVMASMNIGMGIGIHTRPRLYHHPSSSSSSLSEAGNENVPAPAGFGRGKR